jgi:hypothetical protein
MNYENSWLEDAFAVLVLLACDWSVRGAVTNQRAVTEQPTMNFSRPLPLFVRPRAGKEIGNLERPALDPVIDVIEGQKWN